MHYTVSVLLNQMRTERRIALTGSPLMNNLFEYHTMVNWVKPLFLGTRKEYKKRYIDPIKNGENMDSTKAQIRAMKNRAYMLNKRLSKIVDRRDLTAFKSDLPPKREFVLSIKMTKFQTFLYKKYIISQNEHYSRSTNAAGGSMKLFAAYQSLMRVWNHPGCMVRRWFDDQLAAMKGEAKSSKKNETHSDLPKFTIQRLINEVSPEVNHFLSQDLAVVENSQSSANNIEETMMSPGLGKAAFLREIGDDESTASGGASGNENDRGLFGSDAEDSADSDSSQNRNERPRKKIALSGDVKIDTDMGGDAVGLVNSVGKNDDPDVCLMNGKTGTKSAAMEKSSSPKPQSLDKVLDTSKENEIADPNKEDEEGFDPEGSDPDKTNAPMGNAWWRLPDKDRNPPDRSDGSDSESVISLKDLLFLSNKMVTMLSLLALSVLEGDKILVFSQSVYALNMMELFLQLDCWGSLLDYPELPLESPDGKSVKRMFSKWQPEKQYYRIDGSTQTHTRKVLIDKFNKSPDARLFLISTKAGNMGINLQSANRVVIFDSSFNPVNDLQSIFRVYRYGQTKNVFVYRLLAAGTMEETIYRQQVRIHCLINSCLLN